MFWLIARAVDYIKTKHVSFSSFYYKELLRIFHTIPNNITENYIVTVRFIDSLQIHD
jgi:hypothetical protein